MIARTDLASRVRSALRGNPIVTLLGPRQCGKTTLARGIAAARSAEWFDLQDPVSRRRLAEPMTALSPLRGLVVIDEAQLLPELLPVLRVLSDRRPTRARFLLLGSAAPEIVRGASESLAGRAAFIDMGGFELAEVGAPALRKLWLRGGLPRAFLARSEAASFAWRDDFIRTFLERDVRELGIGIPAEALRRLWSMVAHYHGQVWNASEIGRSLGEAHTTVKRHVDLLTGAMVLRQLQPWHENLGKRQVKSPKVYVRDTGLLHALMGVATFRELEGNPRLGASWEGFVVESVLRVIGDRRAYFWATQAGAELDLMLTIRGRRYGIEVKYADAPSVTRSMHVALSDLGLERLWVAHPGSARYALGERIEAIGVVELAAMLRRMS